MLDTVGSHELQDIVDGLCFCHHCTAIKARDLWTMIVDTARTCELILLALEESSELFNLVFLISVMNASTAGASGRDRMSMCEI